MSRKSVRAWVVLTRRGGFILYLKRYDMALAYRKAGHRVEPATLSWSLRARKGGGGGR